MNLQTLGKLTLNNNDLISIDNSFNNMPILVELHLHSNKLSKNISQIFQNKIRLKILNLHNNNISIINSFGNYSFHKLTKIDLSHNKLSTLDFVSWLIKHPLQLKINLNYNKIEKFQMMDFTSWDTLKSINILSYGFLKFNMKVGNIYMDLNNNSIVENNDTVKLFPMDEKLDLFKNGLNIFEFIFNNLTCFGQKKNTGLVKVIKIIHLVCDFEQDCPEQCVCKIRPAYKTLIINCSFQLLNEIPMLTSIPIGPIYLEYVELIIDNNNLTELKSANYSGFNNITMIMASNNQIHSIGLKHIPDKLKVLDVTNNSLQFLDDVVIKRFENVSKLYLSGNPWRCDCDAVKLLHFFHLFRHLIIDSKDMTCEDGQEFKSLNPEDLCFQYIYLTVLLLIVILFICSSYIIFITFKKQIKVWLYYHNCCLWWVTEEKLDEDKDYDAFIVFSHFDDSFVTDLILDLEMPPNSFKCCVHLRDWIPGEMIVTQVSMSWLQFNI